MPADQTAHPDAPARMESARDAKLFLQPVGRHLHCISHPSPMHLHRVRTLAALLPLLTLFAAGPSSAQTGGTSGTGTGGTVGSLQASDFSSMYFERWDGKDGDNWVQLNQTEAQFFFNRARCECSHSKKAQAKVRIVPATNTPTKIKTILQSSVSSVRDDARIYASSTVTSCLDVNSVTLSSDQSYCINLNDPLDYTHKFSLTQFSSSSRVESNAFPVAWLYSAMRQRACTSIEDCNNAGNCGTTNNTANIPFWAETNTGDKPDFNQILLTASLVGEAPAAPTKIEVAEGNNALNVKWSWTDTDAGSVTDPTLQSSYLGVQIFCARGADVQVFGADDLDGGPKNHYKPQYMTAKILCPEDDTVDTSSYGAFGNLDPKYLCSDVKAAGTNSYRITGLQNGIYYTVGVAAIDRYGNISPITQVAYGKPIPTVDFYSAYRDNGGQAGGGFCALTGWRRQAGGVTLVGLAVLGLLVAVRRRRKGPPGNLTVLLLLASGALAAGRAHAGSFLDDMDTSDEANKETYPEPEHTEKVPPPPPTWEGSERDFAIELRFGLYMPNVDSEFGSKGSGGAAPQPNALLFGNSRRPMWQIEFDWEVLQAFGTVALGGTIGYWKENGQACLEAKFISSNYATCDRSGADNTSLRLIPLAALLVYRLDEAAKRWGIPVIPYGKIGLNYTIWTVNNGDGNVPNFPKGGRGQGGTAGWQVAVGLSLQLDFIDPSAARGFDSESGVNHTYAFFEMDHIDGSGLYRSDILRVGDNTWFTGLMFEF